MRQNLTRWTDWDKRGCIVGRGVLLDYCAWAERKGIAYSAMSNHAITVDDLKAVAEQQGVTFRKGDILLVRSGWIKWYEENDDEARLKYITNGKAWVGVESSRRTLKWLWNEHFAAVAGDSIGWEVWPPQSPDYSLHDNLLSLWGMPTGEVRKS
jgi:kynurenine formamidase